MRIRVGIIMTTMKITQMKTNRESQAYIREILPNAYWKTTKTIMSCTTEEQLEVCLRMIENYERLMQNSGLRPSIENTLSNLSSTNLLSLTRLKRKQLKVNGSL